LFNVFSAAYQDGCQLCDSDVSLQVWPVPEEVHAGEQPDFLGELQEVFRIQQCSGS
jgi:hypothetical protein